MKSKIIIGLLLLVMIGVIFVFNMDTKADEEVILSNENISEELEKPILESIKYKVDIKGAVKNPGVYEVDSDKRVNDVIALAGGLQKTANTNYINLSAKVTDEMVIWIYTKDEIKEFKLEQESAKYMIEACNCPVVDNTTCLNNSNSSTSNGKDNSAKVNLNTATVEELMTLDGIGESKAKSIIEYRNSNGKFKAIEDIMNVSGIGSSLYDKIKERLSV